MNDEIHSSYVRQDGYFDLTECLHLHLIIHGIDKMGAADQLIGPCLLCRRLKIQSYPESFLKANSSATTVALAEFMLVAVTTRTTESQ